MSGDTRGVGAATSGDAWQSSAGLPLPAAVVLLSFDSTLSVREAISGDRFATAELEGAGLAEVIGSDDAPALEAAAWRALEGRETTLSCGLAGTARELVVHLAPHPHRSGYALAIYFEAPAGGGGDDEDRRRAEELELIAGVTRELARATHDDEVRDAICEAAQSVCSADAAIVFEPGEDGGSLVAVASRGIDAAGATLPLNENSGAAMALRTNVPHFVGDRAGESDGAAAFLRDAGLESVLWQPVSRGRTVRAILAIGWTSQVVAVHERTARLLEFVAVEGAVAIDRGSAFGRLVAMARSDPLTGLDNRRGWEDDLRREIARASRERTPLGVAMIDLDGFKAFNDSHGHPAGDRVLEQLADRWLGELRVTDVLARHGGDEFALALPSCDSETAIATLKRLQAASGDWGGFSAGVVEWDGEEDADALVSRADRALYRAKAEGRGAIHLG